MSTESSIYLFFAIGFLTTIFSYYLLRKGHISILSSKSPLSAFHASIKFAATEQIKIAITGALLLVILFIFANLSFTILLPLIIQWSIVAFIFGGFAALVLIYFFISIGLFFKKEK